MRPIKTCHCGKRCEGTLDLCASCNRLERKVDTLPMIEDKEPLRKQSDEMRRMMNIYVRKKAAFLRRNKKCAVLPHLRSVDVHHRAGRGINSYYDEAAREAGIPLLLDERHWLAVSREGHIEIEKRPAWAKRLGYSEDRLSVKTKIE